MCWLADVAAVREAVLAHRRRSSTIRASEKLLRALLLQVLYTIRSRAHAEPSSIDYNLLFRWFVGLNIGRSGVGCDGVHEAPGPRVLGRRGRSRLVLPGSAGGGTATAACYRMSIFIGGRHADRGVGRHTRASSRRIRATPTEGGSNPSVDFRKQRRTKRYSRLQDRIRTHACTRKVGEPSRSSATWGT